MGEKEHRTLPPYICIQRLANEANAGDFQLHSEVGTKLKSVSGLNLNVFKDTY